MGTNAGPKIANVYLHIYEHRYIAKLIDAQDEISSRKLENNFRYQADLISRPISRGDESKMNPGCTLLGPYPGGCNRVQEEQMRN
jgi:hypothetical protein